MKNAKSKLTELVKAIRANCEYEVTEKDGKFEEREYEFIYKGHRLTLMDYPFSDNYVSKGWTLSHTGGRDAMKIAEKSGREPIEIKVCDDKLRMLFEGKDWMQEERDEIRRQIEELEQRRYRLENLSIYGITF